MKQQQSYRSLEGKKQSNNDNALNVVINEKNESNSTPISIDVVSPFTNKPKLLRSSSKSKIDTQQANKPQLQQSSNNNNLEYNPLNGVSFKPTHSSDVEIVGVKLGNSNQETSNGYNQQIKKKNSLKSMHF